MRIAWVSNLPKGGESGNRGEHSSCSSESLAAYTTSVLIPHLLKNGGYQIELFHRGEASTFHDLPVFPYQRLRERHAQLPYDICLYQVEDHSESQWARIACTLLPGITWFHDLYFASHGPEPILNSAWQVTKERFRDGVSPWAERGGEFKQVAPLAAREATFCLLPLFSVERDALEYRRSIEGSLSAPFFSEQSPAYFMPMPVRESLFSLPEQRRTEDAVLQIALCSGARIEHRSHKVLQALRTLEDRLNVQVQWVVAPEEKGRAEALLEEYSLKEGTVVLRCDLSPDVWARIIAESDVALHLRFSVFGHVQPYVGTSLARGIPTVVTRFGASEELPADIVYQIEPGVDESSQLVDVLTAIASGTAPHENTNGREYAHELYHERAIAAQLCHLLEVTSESQEYQRAMAAWKTFEGSASEALLAEVSEMLEVDPSLQAAFKGEFEKVCDEFGW